MNLINILEIRDRLIELENPGDIRRVTYYYPKDSAK